MVDDFLAAAGLRVRRGAVDAIRLDAGAPDAVERFVITGERADRLVVIRSLDEARFEEADTIE